ncbi:uncharacterized protein EV422DRAFT_572504 [Fimicolochytrium jonesii]|uniref:uncharacterized protein n=1 Tax=Fimicolochytrium jonesii TaxID=1396493 RepID=UPI0022FDE206|nr:uncharacterized protein EV422DRAFT_572504 [Fimicolochytrium jonesii]KAI8815690.1 hypothetical protein EV422DRAFT_572504 [Fimicolochytrium jonesii]
MGDDDLVYEKVYTTMSKIEKIDKRKEFIQDVIKTEILDEYESDRLLSLIKAEELFNKYKEHFKKKPKRKVVQEVEDEGIFENVAIVTIADSVVPAITENVVGIATASIRDFATDAPPFTTRAPDVLEVASAVFETETLPPTFTFFATEAPPETCNAPVPTPVESVVVKTDATPLDVKILNQVVFSAEFHTEKSPTVLKSSHTLT